MSNSDLVCFCYGNRHGEAEELGLTSYCCKCCKVSDFLLTQRLQTTMRRTAAVLTIGSAMDGTRNGMASAAGAIAEGLDRDAIRPNTLGLLGLHGILKEVSGCLLQMEDKAGSLATPFDRALAQDSVKLFRLDSIQRLLTSPSLNRNVKSKQRFLNALSHYSSA